MNTELQAPRGRAFFWIGLSVLPIFWIWWMTKSHFSVRQIRAARLWTLIYVSAGIVLWFICPGFRNRLELIRWSYSFIAFQIGFALWIWLIFRTQKLPWAIVIALGFMDALAVAYVPMQSMPPDPASVMFIAFPAVAHLLVEPVRRYRNRESNRSPHRPLSHS